MDRATSRKPCRTPARQNGPEPAETVRAISSNRGRIVRGHFVPWLGQRVMTTSAVSVHPSTSSSMLRAPSPAQPRGPLLLGQRDLVPYKYLTAARPLADNKNTFAQLELPRPWGRWPRRHLASGSGANAEGGPRHRPSRPAAADGIRSQHSAMVRGGLSGQRVPPPPESRLRRSEVPDLPGGFARESPQTNGESVRRSGFESKRRSKRPPEARKAGMARRVFMTSPAD